jgi:hypothetical protein
VSDWLSSSSDKNGGNLFQLALFHGNNGFGFFPLFYLRRGTGPKTVSEPGLHTFYKNLSTTSKFWPPEWWHEATSILKTHKY